MTEKAHKYRQIKRAVNKHMQHCETSCDFPVFPVTDCFTKVDESLPIQCSHQCDLIGGQFANDEHWHEM